MMVPARPPPTRRRVAPTHGAAYQPAAERRSWTAVLDFFDEIFA